MESSDDLSPPLLFSVDRIIEEFSKPLISLLKKALAQSLESPELQMKGYWSRWSKYKGFWIPARLVIVAVIPTISMF